MQAPDPPVWEPGPASSHKAQVIGSIALTLQQEPPVPEPKPIPFWLNPAFVISVMMLPLVYAVALIILWPYEGNNYSNEIKIMVVSAVLSNGILTAVLGYWLMTSASSEKKTDAMIAGKLTPPPPITTVTKSLGDAQVTTSTTTGEPPK